MGVPGAPGRGRVVAGVDMGRRRGGGGRDRGCGPWSSGTPTQPAVGVLGQEEPLGVEPGLGHALLEVPAGPAALIGQVGEGCGVEGHPRVDVTVSVERAQRDPGGQVDGAQRGEQGAAQLPEPAYAVEPVRGRQLVRGGIRAVGPQPQPPGWVSVGGTFDPASINTTAALEELFKKIQASGPAPLTIGSMDWSLGNHFLALAYAAQPDGNVDKFLSGLKSGSVKIADNAAYKGLLDTFDVMKKYNKGKNDPLSTTYEQTAASVAKGEAGITFNGNWMISELQKSNATGEFGFIPVPVSNNAGDKTNSAIAIGATKQIFIDKTKNTEEQQAAAKKFLNWIVYEQAGQDFLVNKASIIPAFKNITLEPKDSLAKSIKAYNNAGKSIPFAGNYVPGDHWKVLGASMQKYLVNKDDLAALAAEIADYWKNVK